MTSIRAAREPKSGASGSLCNNVLWMARVGTKIQLGLNLMNTQTHELQEHTSQHVRISTA